MDWFDPSSSEARSQIRRLNASMKVGGRVLLRSAGLSPWYLKVFEEEGYGIKRVGTRNPGNCIDRYHISPLLPPRLANRCSVNMYVSTWLCTKRRDAEGSTRSESVGELVL